MAKREYSGDPIDLTNLPGEQHISERGGETVAGTSGDDLFNESTEWLPEGITEDDLSEGQKNAVLAFLAKNDKENVDFEELAAENDFTKQTARRGIHKVFREYRDIDDLSDAYKLGVLIHAHHHNDDTSAYGLAEEYPISRTVLGNTSRTYPDLIKEHEPITERELDEAVEAYLETHPSKRENQNTNGQTSSQSTNQQSTVDKEWPSDFSECQQWFIETISDYPSLSVGEIGEKIPEDAGGQRKWSSANFHNNIRQYPELIARLIAEKETISDISDMNSYLQAHLSVSTMNEIDQLESSEGNADQVEDAKNDISGQAERGEIGEIDKRLRAVESKVESIRNEIEEIDTSGKQANNQLAEIVINSLSDEQLGKILRGAMQNE